MSLLDALDEAFEEVRENPETFGEMADGTYQGKFVKFELTESKKGDPMVIAYLLLDGKENQTKKYIWLGSEDMRKRGQNEILEIANGLGMPEDFKFSDVIQRSEEFSGQVINYIVTSYKKKDKTTGKNYKIEVLGDELEVELEDDDDPFA